jgi:predicted CXXCH cytochrome family protein
MSTAPNPPGTFVAPAATQETGKRRASRIPLDYFKRWTSLDKWKLGGSLLTLAAVVGYFAYAAFSSAGEERYSRGPVTHHHANLECAACHEGFTSVTGMFGSRTSAKVSNEKCEKCHAGPLHHPDMNPSLTVSCGGCHREHRGADASLVRLPNSDCTSCHETLSDKYKATDFVTNHPRFAFEPPEKKKDPGTISFSHAQHMTPGQVYPADSSGKKKFKDLEKTEVDRYKRAQGLELGEKTDNEVVKLSCASCHQLDVGDFGLKEKPAGLTEAALQPRGSGAYYQPIIYDVACKACHPLTFDSDLKDEKGSLISAPHRVQPDELKRFVEGAYLREYVKPGPSKVFADVKNRLTAPLPGHLPPGEPGEVNKAVHSRTDAELKILSAKCTQCHSSYSEGKVEPANIPQVWQPHARFNHVSHRVMDCRSCHPNAAALLIGDKEANPNASKVNTDVNLPDIANCRQCHAPAQTVSGKRIGGIRDDCTGCHSYHHGTAPLQGLGAAARDPAK